jgi:hypothetical protein
MSMKRMLLAATALALGSAGLAQTTSTTQAATGAKARATVAPGNAAPEVDARGIPVVSDPAAAPAGANQTVQIQAGATVVPAPNQSAVFATQASTKTYPPCTKGVTDGCVQTYEKGKKPR